MKKKYLWWYYPFATLINLGITLYFVFTQGSDYNIFSSTLFTLMALCMTVMNLDWLEEE